MIGIIGVGNSKNKTIIAIPAAESDAEMGR
ncbi:MAG: hypothetical protein BMS9Abin05_1486 [Rhodothermia bacterium]|nr:MAG: hypothetical protein BMS9Abin05_1486 [Rhodothermia bacterium]